MKGKQWVKEIKNFLQRDQERSFTCLKPKNPIECEDLRLRTSLDTNRVKGFSHGPMLLQVSSEEGDDDVVVSRACGSRGDPSGDRFR